MAGDVYVFRSGRAIALCMMASATYIAAAATFWLISGRQGGKTGIAILAAAALGTFWPLRMRLCVDGRGLDARNLVFRHRVAWTEIDDLRVRDVEFAFGIVGVVVPAARIYAPALSYVSSKKANADLRPTALLGHQERERLVRAIDLFAPAQLQGRITTEDLAEASLHPIRQAPAAGRSEEAWDDNGQVSCAFCGRLARVEEMQPLEPNGDSGWSCLDQDRCDRERNPPAAAP